MIGSGTLIHISNLEKENKKLRGIVGRTYTNLNHPVSPNSVLYYRLGSIHSDEIVELMRECKRDYLKESTANHQVGDKL